MLPEKAKKGKIKMKEKVMVLKIKDNRNSSFYEKDRARLFDSGEIKKLADLAAACIRIGCEIKVEMEEKEK